MSLTRSTFSKTAMMLLAVSVGALALSGPVLSAQSETQQGQQIVSEVQSGRRSAASLSSEQYARVGQYLMSRAFHSTENYEVMDSRMDQIMGTTGSDQMYRYLGERYLGKNVQPEDGYGSVYGRIGSMMGSYGGSGPYAGMMDHYLEQGSGNATSGSYPMGSGGMMGYGSANRSSSSSDGWSTRPIVAVAVLGALLIGGAILIVWPRLRRRGQGGRPAAPTAT